MMTRFLVLATIIALDIVHSDACFPPFGKTEKVYIYPYYKPSNGEFGIRGTIRFKRDTEGKREVFDLIDADGDKYISACEWIEEEGSVKNFVEFLNDDDTDGDEKISWDEFQKVTVHSRGA